MSKIKDNIITTGLSGKLGEQVIFRYWSGKTFLAKAPVANRRLIKSEIYERSKNRFREANEYAKSVMDNPELKQIYKNKCKERLNAYTRAVQDYLIAPSIEAIDLSNYTGEPDSFIRIHATDDFEVNRVQVRIEDVNGRRIETGFARQESDAYWWKFIVTERNPYHKGGKVIVSASDLPGNETRKEMFVV